MIEYNREEIISKIDKKLPNLKCPICNQDKFTLIDGFFRPQIHKAISTEIFLSSPSVPTVGLVCNHCGNFIQFSIVALGISLENPKI